MARIRKSAFSRRFKPRAYVWRPQAESVKLRGCNSKLDAECGVIHSRLPQIQKHMPTLLHRVIHRPRGKEVQSGLAFSFERRFPC